MTPLVYISLNILQTQVPDIYSDSDTSRGVSNYMLRAHYNDRDVSSSKHLTCFVTVENVGAIVPPYFYFGNI